MRLLFALVGTAAGLAALLSYKTHGPAANTATAPMTGTQASSTSASAGGGTGSAASASPASQGSKASTGSTATSGGKSTSGGKTSPGSKPTSGSKTTSGSPGNTGGSSATQTVTGAVANTQYGPMQVQVTLTGRKITGVKVLQETDLGSLSQQIDANAIPQLNQETLAAQSARIDAVSGASYTSQGYIQSLQSALDKATA
jgi:uncharacterized protein with FMN-binding domain